MNFSQMFKDSMIRKMTGPDAISATALSRQVNISQTTLSKWLRNAGIGSQFGFPNNITESAPMPNKKKSVRPQDLRPEDKLKIIIDASSLDDEQLGAFLREKGLHETHLEQWRLQMIEALQKTPTKPRKDKSRAKDTKKIRILEKELLRKEKALAEAAALLILKKKVQQIWGDEDDDTSKRSGK